MVHRLARKHYVQHQPYQVFQCEEGESFTYLNLNINSLTSSRYKIYPRMHQEKLAWEYLKVLSLLHSGQALRLKTDSVLFTQGAAEGIDLIIRAFCEPKEEAILVTSPTFPYYAYRANIENVPVINVPLVGPHFNRLNIDRILNARAKVLFLCTPNNPVGTLLDLGEIEILLQQFLGIVVIDEAYIEWTEEKTAVEWVLKYDNLIVLRTFSKIWGIAGARIGVAIADRTLIQVLHLVQPLFSFPDSSADIAFAKLKEIDKILQYRKEMKRLRRMLHDFLSTLSNVEKVYPGMANFLLVVFRNAQLVAQRLFEKHILVADVFSQLPSAIRISVGSQEETYRLMEILAEIEQT